MILKATNRFMRDVEKIKSIELIEEIGFIIDEIEKAESPQDIPGFKIFKKFSGFGRIRASDYRIGVQFSSEIVILRCLLHRSVIYKNFP